MEGMTDASAVELVAQAYTENFIQMAAAAVILYDLILVVSQELALVRNRRWSSVTLLCASNRLLALLFAATLPLGAINVSSVFSCNFYAYLNVAAELPLNIVWAAFNGLRTYAIGRRAVFLALLVFGVSLVPFLTTTYNIARYTSFSIVSFTPDISICSLNSPESTWFNIARHYRLKDYSHMTVEVITRCASILGDAMVVGITWWKSGCLAEWRDFSSAIHTRLVRIMVVDGTLYFIALLLVNSAQLITTLATGGVINVIPITTALTSVIVSRFLLSLRREDDTAPRVARPPPYFAQTQTQTQTCVSEMQFALSDGEDKDAEGSFGLSDLSSETAV